MVNPYHAKFFKWNNPPYNFGTFHYHFQGCQDENLKLSSYTGGKENHFRCWQNKG